MKRMILNIMATMGITLVALSIVALCYDATVICINTVFQSLLLDVLIYVGIYILNHFEYRYPILETGLKLIYVLTLALVCGWFFGWYANLSMAVLTIMTVVIFVVCTCLDTFRLMDEVKAINVLLEKDNEEREKL